MLSVLQTLMILGQFANCTIGFEVILTVHRRYYVKIKCQLDATDDIYCRFYCMQPANRTLNLQLQTIPTT